MTTRRLEGKRAVVTGASSGIGRAIALAYAAEGAEVLLTYRKNEAGARATLAAIHAAGQKGHVVEADLASEAAVARLVEAAFGRLGKIDVWVNNAGADILTGEGARLSDRDKLALVLDVDVRSSVLCSWAVGERLRAQGGGTLLNMSWDHALVGAAGRACEIYAAAKGAILSFSKSLARSLAPTVRVHVLAPGWIATAFGDGLPAARREAIAASIPLRRWGTPEDVARAAVFLASADADFMTGSTLLVNGGAVM